MKMKLTTLLFGLLLAVGWTSNVFAQSATYKAEDIKDWTYTWEDAGGTTQTGKYIDEVTDPYQMYGLLRWIYMDKRFPGPYYSAYDKNGNREREVYYGGMDGGWEIPGTPINAGTTTIPIFNDIVIEFGGTSSNGTNAGGNFSFSSIEVKSGNTVLTSWNYATWTNNVPTGWGFSSNKGASVTTFNDDGNNSTCYISQGGSITIPGSILRGKTNVTIVIRGNCDANYTSNPATITVSDSQEGSQGPITSTTSTAYTWNIVSAGTETVSNNQAIGDITITGNNTYARISSIVVKSGSTTITSWDYATYANNFPIGWSRSGSSPRFSSDGWFRFPDDVSAVITLAGWMFEGYSNVTVEITAYNSQSNYAASLIVNGESKDITTTYYESQGTPETKSWSITPRSFNAPVEYQADQYKPDEEGYTVLVVKLKNNLILEPNAEGYSSQQSFYDTKAQIINYLKNNVKSIQLLTDGLRIGQGEDVGTVFSCPSTDVYNRFFFLGKGQARQKTDVVRSMQVFKEHVLGEQVPFRQMFEQFSPTSGDAGADVKDFYSKMMKGQVFPVVHDCLSVIQNQHEFSMSGHDGTTSYDMPGMNFFIPDYRLKYWEEDFYYKTYTINSSTGDTTWTTHGPYHVDGRIMNPYQTVSASGDVTVNKSLMFRTPSQMAVWYAQYDTAHHAPVTGIYLLTLQGEANKVSDYSEPDNRYYNVDLYWRSSLNEMAGSAVEQTYIIYQVVTDSVTGVRRRVAIDTVKNCTDFRPHLQLDTLYQQHAHSYTLTYIIEGSPVDSDHPGFVAWSNEVKLIIPGYDDFMILKLHHYESDFEIRRVGDVDYNAENGTYDEKNYYRNYLQPENDIVNGITAESILGGYDSFMLYRSYTVDGIQVKEAVAKLKFAVDQQGKVLYKITYIDEHENYHAPNFDNTELVNVINQLLNNQ